MQELQRVGSVVQVWQGEVQVTQAPETATSGETQLRQ